MNFNARALQTEQQLMRVLGEPAIFNGLPIQIMIDDSVQIVGDFGQVIENRMQITVLKEDIPILRKGDVITTQTGRMLKVDGTSEENTFTITAWVK